MALDTEERLALLRLARAAIDDAVAGGDAVERELSSVRLTEALEEERGAFVTLHTGGGGRSRLRGCIGVPRPEAPLFRNVMRSAVDSALRDPRFPPVGKGELAEIVIEVSALGPRRPVASPDEIRPGVHGVVLEKDAARALFLPQVAPEQGWGTAELLEHLALKAGLPRDGWRGARLEVFEAEVFGESHPL